MTEFYTLKCGCQFPITNEKKVDLKDGIPSIEIDFEKLSLNCIETYGLLATGKTLGVFQLEKILGQTWSKKLEPVDIEEVAALISILRPGTLKSKMENANGKMVSMTQHFIDRKHFREEFEPIDESISEITQPTYSIIVYQEQAMKIAQKVAGFNLQQADQLRKAMGKKDAALMAKVRIQFIEGCKVTGIITDEKANEIFDIIEKSNRYSFNASHAYGYGLITIWSAYMKSHFPHIFFESSLLNSDNKADYKEEVNLLINDGKLFGMSFAPPSILNPHANFQLSGLTIEFGLSNISGIGEKYIAHVNESIKIVEEKLNKKFNELSWFEILFFFSPLIKSNVMKNLVSVGAFSHIPMYRRYMLFELNKFDIMTEREIEWIKNSIITNIQLNNLQRAIEKLLIQQEIKITDKRKIKLVDVLKTLQTPPNELKDSEEWISNVEQSLMGVELTCSKLDACNTSMGNCKCAEFDKADLKNYTIAATIAKVGEYRPKQGVLKGQTMAYITLSDSTGSCEGVAFPAKYKELDFLLFEGNTVCVTGKKTDSGSLQINNVTQI